MNRNQESHFSTVPRMNHKRSTFDRSHSLATAFQFGSCVPILCEEILPGDSVQLNTSKILRLQTLLTPAYANMYADTYFFFVPNRILWDHWNEFMGENTRSAWYPTVEYSVPKIKCPEGGFAEGTIADYLGYPTNMDWSTTDRSNWPSCLPLRAYAMTMNEFFRDQNISDPVVLSTSDTDVIGRNDGTDLQVMQGGNPYHASKFKDLYTMCVPSPQKGPSVRVPLAGRTPVIAENYHGLHTVVAPSSGSASGYKGTPMTFDYIPETPFGERASSASINTLNKDVGSVSARFASYVPANPVSVPSYQPYTSDLTFYTNTTANSFNMYPTNLWADGTVPVDGLNRSVAGIDINALRLGVLTQAYYERLAMSGSRYEEQLNAFFGVSNPDSRVNHPEYIGGSRVSINVHEVTNTAQSEQDFLGDVGAQSVTADTHFDVNKSFTEHGILLGICVCRYDHIHTSKGMPRWFMRTSKFDFYNPIFADIGYQPVYEYELFADASNLESKQVFGYNEAWIHYRTASNRVSGALKPQNNTSLAHWTLADNFASAPTLSDGWIKEDPTPIDRISAVSHTVAPQVFADFYFHLMHTRPMPMFSVPGAIGSF